MAMFIRRYCSSSIQTQQLRSDLVNSSINQLVQNGFFTESLELYTKLCNNGFKPDNFTFPYILKASTQIKNSIFGFLIHDQIIKTGFDSNVFVSNSLILFYGKLGYLQSVQDLFDRIPDRNTVTWTAMISSFTQNQRFDLAIELFREMQIEGISPNSFTMASLLPCFSYNLGLTQIHSFLVKHGFESDVFVSTALTDVYAKCGDILTARRVFDEMPERNIVSWNAICLGYNQNGNPQESLKLFAEMQKSSQLQPDSFSVITALCCCSNLALLNQGKQIHGYVHTSDLQTSVIIGNGLVDMYGKCGLLELAEQVFDRMQEKDVGSWTTLISCYGFNGKGSDAISIFEKMKETNPIIPNSVTFKAILSACSHSQLVEDGFKYFQSMVDDFGIEPTMEHYVCMVDLLGRAGKFEKALKFINEMPIEADYRVWEALLGSATTQGETVIALIAANYLMELESENIDLHVQLANIYANSGRWDDVERIRSKMKSMKLRKNPGFSSVHVVP